MSSFNRFGAVAADVLRLYPGTAFADYGSQTAVEEAIDRSVDRILAAMPESTHNQLVSPDLVLVVPRATTGQTTATIPLTPIVSGTARIWIGQPILFQDRPIRLPVEYPNDPGVYELDTNSYTVNLTSGLVTLTSGMSSGDQMYASCDINVTSTSYSAPSLARMAVRGAAAALGSVLYSESNEQWRLVADYRREMDQDLEALSDGKWIPEEIRYLKWWKEVDRSSQAGASSVRLYRG